MDKKENQIMNLTNKETLSCKKRIIFLGGVGKEKQFGGELTKNKEIIRRLRELGAQVTVLDSFGCSRNKFKLIKLLLRFWGNVLTHPKATFIFSTSFGNIYPLMRLLRFYPVKLHMVYWVIGGNLVERIQAGIYAEKYLKMMNLYIVEGKKIKHGMELLGYKNVLYLPNFKTIGTLPIAQKYRDGRIHFLFLSRITPDKGCRYIMQSIRKLNSEGLSAKFTVDFYGRLDEEYREEFDTDCKELPNVSYLGSINLKEEKNYTVIARYHYMLFPTYWLGEGFPGVVIDAYKAGLPLLASDWNLNPEFIEHGHTGFIYPTHSVDGLVEVMKRAVMGIANYNELVHNCQEAVYRYDTNNVVDIKVLNMIGLSLHGGSLIRELLKKSKWVYFSRYKWVDTDYKVNLKRMKVSTLKSKQQIKLEMKMVADYWKCDPAHYVRYGLFNKLLSQEELLDYIPTYYYYNFYLSPQLKEVNRKIYDDKLQLYYLFQRHHIATPEVLAVVHHGRLCEPEGLKTCDTLLQKSFRDGERLFFKPVNGQGGTGIKVFKKGRDGKLSAFISRLDHKTQYVVQAGIEQRADIAKINDSSVNTLRMITQFYEGKPHLCACVMRIGRNGREVDNSHQGGMSIEIDVKTGAFSPLATAEHGGGTYPAHPDSGFIFKGKTIEGWKEIRSTVLAYADEFPCLREIGWDIALTKSGIQAIEMNLGFGLAHLQVTCGGMRRKLNLSPDYTTMN
ncbi:sugar-transfer associated ATP-grasp domain-containing protein [Parabacteroides distasonis]|uniref:sugar-transfer associated ATP-grasp domain-containing protein n=1 Tax=Parabacteroides distasonis TaxID=823 RepID=UPI003F7433ED